MLSILVPTPSHFMLHVSLAAAAGGVTIHVTTKKLQ